MALRRAFASLSRRQLSSARTMLASVEETTKEILASKDPAVEGKAGVTGRIPEDYEQATGLERLELLEIAKGNEDPFGLEGVKWGPQGTKEAPRLIPSHFEERLVGCCCDPESEQIKYFYVKSGAPQPCPCAQQYFALEKAESHVSW
eukprot:m.351777 g.351777  ORF g.351777 m.351777 type:complete len:147 (-) comp16346_c0_seq1:148-588(-)